MDTILQNTIHILLALTLPPLLLGVIGKTKAFFGGRVGPPLLQPYFDLIKLFQKGSVFSPTTTWIFRAGPVVGLVTPMMALLMLPLVGTHAPISFKGDLLLLVYLLALSRFFTASAALDTGSAFEGLGAAREVTYACLVEPAFFMGLLVLARLSGSLQPLSIMLGGLAPHWFTAGGSLIMVLLSWFIVLLAENSRVPIDDPNTHLELTMVHEVMVLDHSGAALGMIMYGATLKLFVYAALIVRLVFPLSTGYSWLDWPLFTGEMLLVAVAIGVAESTRARLRLPQIPVLLLTACLLSAFGIILLLR